VKIIAIDPGTRRTGYAVFDVRRGVPTMLECGLIFVRGRDLPERLLHIHRGIERLIRRLRPKHTVIETPFVGKSTSDALTLAAARGVCMLAGAASKCRVYEYAPAQVKKAATGNGRAPKPMVQRMVRMRLGLRENPPTDAADAIALALCHIDRM
jgi:crossover junction endodeoxyribonuclease RuvC